MKYRRREIVDAEQWFPGVQIDGVEEHKFERSGTKMLLDTKGGVYEVFPGDWVVTFPDGNRKLMSDSYFQITYEEVRE